MAVNYRRNREAAEAVVDTLTIGLTREVAEEGIRVKDLVPMKRGGQPAEVAAAILWLLSEEASFTTGTFIDVTGGK